MVPFTDGRSVMKNGTYRACPKAHNELKSLAFSESQIPSWISRVNIQSEGEAPIVQGEPIEEGGPPSLSEETSPHPSETPSPPQQVPLPLGRPLVDTRRPLGNLPLGQEAREPERGRGEASEALEASERGEGVEEGLENVYEREARFTRQLRDQGIFETVDGYGQARAG